MVWSLFPEADSEHFNGKIFPLSGQLLLFSTENYSVGGSFPNVGALWPPVKVLSLT